MLLAPSGSATAAIAELVAAPLDAPDPALDALAGRAVLDTVGVALAAAGEPTVEAARTALSAGDGPCSVWLGGRRAAPDRAALLNGLAAHALDYDDVDDLTIGHPSTVLVPAALAAAETVRADGARVVEAYGRGLRVARALAAGLGITAHYARGWHSTSTTGTVAAAVAAATVLGLDPARAEHAVGIAVSRTAGSRQNFGSMTKPLHAGAAASDGVLAAELARAGFTAGREIVEGRSGYLALYGADDDTEGAARRVIDALAAPDPAGLNIKLHPCCYATHATADATLELVAAGLTADEVAGVEVSVPVGSLAPLQEEPARTGLEGKFSMAHVVASCLVDGDLGLGSFTDAAVARPAVRPLAGLVRSDEELSGSAGLFGAEVVVRRHRGEPVRARCDAPRGHVTRPAPDDAVLAKFVDCAAFAGHPAGPDLGRRLLGIARCDDVAALLADLIGTGTP